MLAKLSTPHLLVGLRLHTERVFQFSIKLTRVPNLYPCREGAISCLRKRPQVARQSTEKVVPKWSVLRTIPTNVMSVEWTAQAIVLQMHLPCLLPQDRYESGSEHHHRKKLKVDYAVIFVAPAVEDVSPLTLHLKLHVERGPPARVYTNEESLGVRYIGNGERSRTSYLAREELLTSDCPVNRSVACFTRKPM